ncbi:MAG: hypothetical protein ACE14S_12615 [Candidatus Bathyarchaeia archaeon]
MGEKKTTGRKATISLGALSAVLIVLLAVTLLQRISIINSKDSEIGSKNQQIASLNSQVSDLNQQTADLNGEVSSLDTQISSLNTQILDLKAQNASQQDEILRLNAEVTRINGVVDQLKSEISQRDDSIGNLLTQVDELKAQLTQQQQDVANLRKANLVTSLGIADRRQNDTLHPNTYHLTIEGTVFNGGVGTAYHPGLKVLAYYITDAKAIDTTVALNSGNAMQTGQQVNVREWVYYEQGVLKNYTVIPVWSNIP